MNRRSFIKRTGWLLAGGMMLRPLESWTKPRARQWALLNTNDFHSRFLPFPANHRRYPNQGGMARLTSVIQEYRSKYEHLALFDCGDVFQGTPYFNVFQGDPELSWMKKMGYDATTLGNHDFDKGVNHLYTLRKRHQTPTVLCNYEMSESELQEIVTPYKVIKKGPVKIGVTGVCVNLEGLIGENNRQGLSYINPIDILQENINQLRHKENCDTVLVLSHLGFEYPDFDKIDDLTLAKKTSGIDLILGGHTHTFLDEPVTQKNKDGKDVVIHQAGWAGLRMGRFVFEY